MAPERRVDPEDGATYTYEELAAFYAGKYKKAAILAYWDNECQAAAAAKSNAKVKSKAAAKPRVKAKAKAEAEAETKTEAAPRRKPAAVEDVIKRVSDCKVVPVVKVAELAHAVPLAQALKDGGVDVIEITFRTACAADAIREVCKSVEGICVGAGTVLSPAQVDEALDGGADFIVSPGFDAAVAKRCRSRGALYLPGVITPTEVMMVMSRFKLRHLKFFPASNFGGAGTLKSYAAIFPDVKFMPTGGVTEENIRSFTSMPNIMAAGGTWFVSDSLVNKAAEANDWSAITVASQQAAKVARGE